MSRLSRFTYGASTFTAEIEARPWNPRSGTVGGRRRAASGVSASYIIRRDVLLELTLRFFEHEWPDVLNLLTAAQESGATVTWYPDADDTATSFLVDLEDPAAGVPIVPTREGDFARAFELTIVLRGVGAVAPWLDYFDLSGD